MKVLSKPDRKKETPPPTHTKKTHNKKQPIKPQEPHQYDNGVYTGTMLFSLLVSHRSTGCTRAHLQGHWPGGAAGVRSDGAAWSSCWLPKFSSQAPVTNQAGSTATSGESYANR